MVGTVVHLSGAAFAWASQHDGAGLPRQLPGGIGTAAIHHNDFRDWLARCGLMQISYEGRNGTRFVVSRNDNAQRQRPARLR